MDNKIKPGDIREIINPLIDYMHSVDDELSEIKSDIQTIANHLCTGENVQPVRDILSRTRGHDK